MPWTQHKRRRYIDYIRQTIGDPDKLLFTDDELKSHIEKWTRTDLTTSTPTASNERYRIRGCSCGDPIYELNVSTGVDDAVYVLDEYAGLVFFDAVDPDNAAASPVDGSQITVQFYTVNSKQLFSELFMVLSSNHAKLKLAHNIMGVQMDLKELSTSFYDQAVRWVAEGCHSGGGCC